MNISQKFKILRLLSSSGKMIARPPRQSGLNAHSSSGFVDGTGRLMKKELSYTRLDGFSARIIGKSEPALASSTPRTIRERPARSHRSRGVEQIPLAGWRALSCGSARRFLRAPRTSRPARIYIRKRANGKSAAGRSRKVTRELIASSMRFRCAPAAAALEHNRNIRYAKTGGDLHERRGGACPRAPSFQNGRLSPRLLPKLLEGMADSKFT